jgi:hypothetical protein
VLVVAVAGLMRAAGILPENSPTSVTGFTRCGNRRSV